MTLLELLMVLTIVSLLFGATAGMLSGLDVAPKAAFGALKSALRGARNAAIAGGGARVSIDKQKGTLVAHLPEVAGSWHFETPGLEGAFGIDGSLLGAALSSDGYLGRALAFGPTGARAEMPIAALARFDLTHGFALEFALRSEGHDGGNLVDVGGAAGVVLTSSQALRGWMAPVVVDESGRAQRGARIAIETPPGALEGGRWSRVRLVYLGDELALELDGVTVATSDGALELAVSLPDAALVLGDPGGTLAAAIDALTVWAYTPSETLTLDPGVRFGPRTPARLSFDSAGFLDLRHHQQALTIELIEEDGTSHALTIGPYGTLE